MRRNQQQDVNGKVVTVIALALAGFVAVTGFAMLDAGFGHKQWSTISQAHAVSAGPNAAGGIVTVAAHPARSDEVWAADESAKGTRPEASH